MKMVADACTIILLAKAGILEIAMDSFDVAIPEEVYNEVAEGKAHGAEDAFLLERLKNNKKFSLVIPRNKFMVEKIMMDFSMGKGEAAAVVFALEAKTDALATDNRQGRKVARINNIPLIGSISIITGLCKMKKIAKGKAIEAIEVLREEGWFEEYLIEEAKEEISHG
ncbi:hypothetical protein HYU14_02875 [Candidatus Woesearchaeota archaeon]|nr:hypothetical protein [Candidatus Woesearchaeota archaeon]